MKKIIADLMESIRIVSDQAEIFGRTDREK